MKILAAVGAILSFILALYLNYLPETEAWTGNKIGEVSSKYRTLVTPANYAFSIWGIIYLSMIGFLIFQFKRAFEAQRTQGEMQNIRLVFIILHLLNAAWVVSWTYEYLILSVLLIIGMLISTIYILIKVRTTHLRGTNKWLVQYPFEVYSGWLTAATVANVSATIQSLDIIPLFLEGIVALVILFIVWWIYYRIWNRFQWVAFNFVGIWVFIAIGVNQYNSNAVVSLAAWASAAFLLSLFTPRVFKKK